ncbi:MAG: DUF1257 domain-containing protein [Shewanella sp.]|nr:DUF1257 domain-containing protein [Shewanella sp.]
MSHTTTIKGVELHDRHALQRAIDMLNQERGLNLQIIDNAKPRAYYTNQAGMSGEAEMVIKCGGRYDVGLYRNEQGVIEPRFDAWGGDISKELGNGSTKSHIDHIGGLLQEYSIAAATIAAENSGQYVNRVKGEDGSVRLTVTGY